MFVLKMQLGLLALLCSSAFATQPVQSPKKQQVLTETHTKDATSHLRKSPSTTEPTKKQEDANAIAGLVKGLSSVPTKDGKVVKGFANKVNHPSVRALHSKSEQQSTPQKQAKPAAKPVITEEKSEARSKPASPKPKAEAKAITKAKPSEAKPVAKTKSAHQPKVSKPKPVPQKEKQEEKPAVQHHPALVARSYPSLVPRPATMNHIATSAVSSTMTEEERAKKVQHAMDSSDEVVQSVDKDVEEARKEASEAHKIAQGK
jgi:hypothetical protein